MWRVFACNYSCGTAPNTRCKVPVFMCALKYAKNLLFLFLQFGLVFVLHWLICLSWCPYRSSIEMRLLIYLFSENDICTIMYAERVDAYRWMNGYGRAFLIGLWFAPPRCIKRSYFWESPLTDSPNRLLLLSGGIDELGEDVLLLFTIVSIRPPTTSRERLWRQGVV